MQAQKYSIKMLSKDERPREKLRMMGVQGLTNAELLAILLHSGTKSDTAIDLARHVLGISSNSLARLGRLTLRDLQQVRGIGEVRAMSILAAFELGRRRQADHSVPRTIIHNSKEMAEFLQTMLEDYRHEVFGVAFLNRANKVAHFEIISQGGIAATIVDTKIIIRKALEQDATSLVLFHNHPSGSLRPSTADESLTLKIQEAAGFFEIKVIDHLIISREGYYSFADNGQI